MELRYQMTDILPLLPIPQPPYGKSAYNIPCPLCDKPGTREKHLNINLKRNVYRCPKCGQFQGGVFELYAYYMGIPQDKVLDDITASLHGGTTSFGGKGGQKKKIQAPPMKPQASLAPLEERDRVYRALLNRLTLAPDHRESLLRRGLTDEAIERSGYKSTPVVGFHALAQSLLDEGYTLFGVPGFYRDEDGRWTMAVWRRGILIPGTYFGKIQGFQIRLDHKMKKGGKFLTFSSRDELDGTMGENWCHMVGPAREKILLIEGYMKADIVHHFTGQTMLAIPGVTSLQHLEAALKDLIPLGVRHVMTCFDMDYLKNWHVENAYRNLVTLLGKLDITFGTYLWVPDHNGLDDYIWEFCLNQGWTLSGQRISYMRDKTKDERYFILTLFAIAKELEKSGNTSPMVEADLAVGLPPEHYALRQRFADYFKRGRVNFVFNGVPICLMIRHVFVYPQAYAAVVPQAGRLKEIPRTFIIDIGGYTTDVMLLRNAAPDLQFCRSLEMGVIPMSNDIISRVSAMYDIKIEDDHIADIIQGRPTILPQEVREVVFMKVRSYACDILDKLRELQVDLRANPAIFIGGGSILFRSFVEESPLVAHADFVTDPKANAIGYGMLATAQLRRMTPQNHGGEFFAQG